MKKISFVMIFLLILGIGVLPLCAENENPIMFTADSEFCSGKSVTVDLYSTVSMLIQYDDEVWYAYLEGRVSYRWYKDGMAIAGQADKTLLLTEDYVGCYVQVAVTFGDRTVMSDAVAVTAKVLPPTIPDSFLPDGTAGKPYYLALEYTDPGTVFSIIDSPDFAKTNLTLSADGVLQGTPMEAGEYLFTVMAEGKGEKVMYTYTLTIHEPPHVHAYGQWVTASEPTCQIQGKRVKTCLCGDTLTEWIPVIDHNWNAGIVTKEPTEEDKGIRTHTCTMCYKTATSEIEKLPHTHKYRDWTVAELPTCHREGYNVRTCACGDVQTEYVPRLEHVWDVGVVTKKPTEDEEGIRTFTCTVCRDIRTEKIDKLLHTHVYGAWAVEKEPTCKEMGLQTRACRCGDMITQTLAILPHTWDAGRVTKNPTEKTAGEKTYTCILCRETKTEVIAPLNHTHKYGEWTIGEAPTCQKTGTQIKVCTCGDTISESIPKTDHVWDGGKVTLEPSEQREGERTYTCTVCRETRTEIIDRLDHTHKYGEWTIGEAPTCQKTGTKIKVCSCGDTISESIPKTEHVWDDGKVTVEPSEDQQGERTYTCTVCRETKTEIIDRLDHTHKYGEWIVSDAPTCQKVGLSIRVCRCGDFERKTLPMLAHVWDDGKVTKAPTEETEGEKTFTCTVCRETKTESVAPLGHTHKYGDWTVSEEPTCQKTGTKIQVCSCGDTISEKIPKIDHTWDKGTITKEPTEEAGGEKTFTCTVCRETKIEPVAPLGHTHKYGDWTVSKEPTCQKTGTKVQVCSCGDTISEEIPKIDHTWDKGEITKEPTEEAEGEKTFTCTVCRETKTEPVAPLGHTHKYGDWTVSEEPTCQKTGTKIQVCSCGNTISEEIPKIDHMWDKGEITKMPTEKTEGEKTYICIVCNEQRTESIEILSQGSKPPEVSVVPTPPANEKQPNEPDSIAKVRIILYATCILTFIFGVITVYILKKPKK